MSTMMLKIAAQQNMVAKMRTKLGEEHVALAVVSEEVLAKYFKEADERVEARAKRLEKQTEKMNSVMPQRRNKNNLLGYS